MPGLLLVWILGNPLFSLAPNALYRPKKVTTASSDSQLPPLVLLPRNGVLCERFANLSNPQSEDEAGKVYTLFIGDTVLVNKVKG